MPTPVAERLALCREMRRIALEAAHLIMRHYHAGRHGSAREKHDGSPVTQADKAAETHILRALTRIAPSIPVISEENAEGHHRPQAPRRFFLVDPLDGTSHFLKGDGEFTVNIAYAQENRPECGVLCAPAKRQIFWGCHGGGAYESAPSGRIIRHLRARISQDRPVMILSAAHESHAKALRRKYNPSRVLACGSAIKFALVARGDAHIYPRMGPTMAWDTAAGQAILEAAGGRVLDESGKPLLCEQKSGWKNGAFVASA